MAVFRCEEISISGWLVRQKMKTKRGEVTRRRGRRQRA
jgi:hypothetical protein